MAAESITSRAAGFGLPAEQVDGQDVTAVYRATRQARARAARGDGPSFIEALTYRYRGHNTGDSGTYRTPGEVESWRRSSDPIMLLARALDVSQLLRIEQLDGLITVAREQVADAVTFAEQSPWPDPARALENVTGLPVHVRGNV
jgi:TPP-dependent pyruvate/acetoin dehydrogenase alpha subunit